MPKSPRYIATIDGQTFTRTSDRTYTHVVVARRQHDWSRDKGYHAVEGGDFVVMGFCGSLPLAQKMAQTKIAERFTTEQDWDRMVAKRARKVTPTGLHLWHNVTILPLTDTRA